MKRMTGSIRNIEHRPPLTAMGQPPTTPKGMAKIHYKNLAFGEQEHSLKITLQPRRGSHANTRKYKHTEKHAKRAMN